MGIHPGGLLHVLIVGAGAPLPAIRSARGIARAGVFGEVARRGVLYAMVVRIVKPPWVAVALCSLSFGLAHAVQGPRSYAPISTTVLMPSPRLSSASRAPPSGTRVVISPRTTSGQRSTKRPRSATAAS